MDKNQKPLISVLSGRSLSPPPVWVMRQAGRYLPEYRKIREEAGSFLNLCLNPELAAKVTLQPIKRFNFDAAILFSDILVIPYSLGMDLDYIEGEGPKISKIRNSKDVNDLKINNILKNLKPVFETIKKVKSELPSNISLIGFAGAPWTVATYMFEGGSSRKFEKINKVKKENNKLLNEVIEILVRETSEYLIAQVESGAEVLQIFDSWASSLDEKELPEFVYNPTKKIVENIKKKYPSIKVIGFPKGIGINYIDYIKETGVDAVSVDDSLDLKFIREELQTKVPVQGNLSPEILLSSNKKDIVDSTNLIIDGLSGGSHIFNLGHGILPQTPIENVEIMVDTVRNFTKGKRKLQSQA